MGKFPVHQACTQTPPCSLAGNPQNLTPGKSRAEPNVQSSQGGPTLTAFPERRAAGQPNNAQGPCPLDHSCALHPLPGAGLRGLYAVETGPSLGEAQDQRRVTGILANGQNISQGLSQMLLEEELVPFHVCHIMHLLGLSLATSRCITVPLTFCFLPSPLRDHRGQLLGLCLLPKWWPQGSCLSFSTM